MLIAGVDEAGRGPVIGPMVFAVVVIEEEDEERLKELGVTDSKLMRPDEREDLFEVVKDVAVEHRILQVEAKELNQWMRGASLNEVEVIKTAELLNSLKTNPQVCYVDCPDVKPARYRRNIQNLCRKEMEIIAEHHADIKYPATSAASILAKVVRDEEIEGLKKTYGNIGSGYPGDENTQEWLKREWEKGHNLPDIVRRRWATVERLPQVKLTDY